MLSSSDLNAVGQCLRYLLSSGELSGEFQTRLAVTESETQEMLRDWPAAVMRADRLALIAGSNALNELVNGITVDDQTWGRHFSLDRAGLAAVFHRWRESLADAGVAG